MCSCSQKGRWFKIPLCCHILILLGTDDYTGLMNLFLIERESDFFFALINLDTVL